jgi:hypothetical protein
LEPEDFRGTFKGSSEVYVKRDEEKQKEMIKLMVTTVEKMVSKKGGLQSQGQRQTHPHKFEALSPQIQPESRRENK